MEDSRGATLSMDQRAEQLRTARILTQLSGALFLVGLFAPCFTLAPSLGYGVLDWVFSCSPQSFSVASGILILLKEREISIAAILIVFSVIFHF
jgi:hypothetical protein